MTAVPRTGRAARCFALTLACAFGLAALGAWAHDAHAAQAGHPPARRARSNRLPIAAPVNDARQAWADARALADDGHFDEALVVVRRGLGQHPDDGDLLWLEAGVTGEAGRHPEAVRLYERMLASHPELASDVRTDLAMERVWAGDPQGALRDLRLRIEDEPDDREALVAQALALSHADRLKESLAAYDSLIAGAPGDLSLALERARVLTWMDRNAEAGRAYSAIITRDPASRDARLGLARVQNATGLHRHAIATLAPLAAEPDADPDVLKALAFARYWSGDPGNALETLDAYRTRRPDDREGIDLERRIRRELSASLTLGYSRSDDTDGLRVGTTTTELGLPLGTQNTATLGWQRDNVSDPLGTQDPLQLRAALQTIWSAEWMTRANLSAIDNGSNSGSTGQGELAVTWNPEDRLRIDAGVSREAIITRLALAGGTSALTWVAGADVRPAPRWTLHADARQRFFSDGNRAQAEALSARRDVWDNRTTKLALQARVEQLRTRLDLDHGYYDPAQYLEWGPGADAEWTPRPDVTIGGELWTGWQRERDAPTRPAVNASGRIEWLIERFATLSIEGGRSNSNLQSASGYGRRQWAVWITRGF